MSRDNHSRTAWVARAHALADDLSAPEEVLLLELASIVRDWPAANIVVRDKLDAAAKALLEMAGEAEA